MYCHKTTVICNLRTVKNESEGINYACFTRPVYTLHDSLRISGVAFVELELLLEIVRGGGG